MTPRGPCGRPALAASWPDAPPRERGSSWKGPIRITCGRSRWAPTVASTSPASPADRTCGTTKAGPPVVGRVATTVRSLVARPDGILFAGAVGTVGLASADGVTLWNLGEHTRPFRFDVVLSRPDGRVLVANN